MINGLYLCCIKTRGPHTTFSQSLIHTKIHTLRLTEPDRLTEECMTDRVTRLAKVRMTEVERAEMELATCRLQDKLLPLSPHRLIVTLASVLKMQYKKYLLYIC